MPAPTSPASPWAALLPATLAGTRRQPFAALPGLSPSLGSEAAADTKQLLLTAANLRLVARAGYCPPGGPAEALPRQATPPAGQAAEWPPLGRAAAHQLAALLTAGEFHRPFWKVVFGQLHRQRRRLPHRLLPSALTLLTQLGLHKLLATYAPVFGGRGEWLAARHNQAELRQAAADAAVARHPGAPLARRPAALTELLADDPAQLWQYVLTTLATANDATQTRLLDWATIEVEGTALPAALAPLLEREPLPDPGPSYALGTGPVWRTLRQLPDSAWARRVWARATGYLVLEHPPGAPPRLRLTLPPDAAADDAWRRDGLAPGSPYDYEAGRGWERLNSLLGYLAPSRWAAAWQVSPAEAVALVAALPDAPKLLEAWMRAAGRVHDVDMARALLAHAARTGQNISWATYAAAVLPPAEQAALLQAVLPPLPLTLPSGSHELLWLNWLGFDRYQLAHPPELAAVVLPFVRDFLRQFTANSDYPWMASNLAQRLRDIAVTGPLALRPWFEAELPPLARLHPSVAATLGQCLTYLRLRQALADDGPEPADPGR